MNYRRLYLLSRYRTMTNASGHAAMSHAVSVMLDDHYTSLHSIRQAVLHSIGTYYYS